MPTIYEVKEQAVTDTPLLVFDCVLPDGRAEHWCTHAVTVAGTVYEARVMSHNVFELQAASDQGIDAIPRITLVLGNADSHFSEIERSVGWKGARLTANFLFYDLRNGEPATEASVLFQGICNPPDEIREATFRITATNRMNLQRLLLPQVRIQRRCPWEFPATPGQRTEALDGAANGKYSRYYRCGYSADVAGGTGAMNGGSPFAGCGYTRSDCVSRGMFVHFGGIEYVPAAIQVRTYGDKSNHTSAISLNEARYNDFVPMVYGTAWYNPPVVFARNDGNLTRMEVLLGIGEMQGVLKVLVNGVEIPAGVSGTNMTGTGWYNVPTLGTRAGATDPDFADGDPYGSMAYASVVVPNRLNDGSTLPKVAVLAAGLKLPTFASDGTPLGEQFSANPAWIVLDMLRRAGWGLDEIDAASFAVAAAYCDETITAMDLYGNPTMLPRFACNVVLQKRKAAGDVVRGVRNSARLLLTYGSEGRLELRMENSMALERQSKPDWSNASEVVDGGWPSYEFGDGSNGISGILRSANGEPSVRLFSRSTADTPNRLTVEFQDSLNEYQQDSFSLVDADDVARGGQEVAAPLAAIGIANYDQACRVVKLNLDKSVSGNVYIDFDTSVKCLGIRPGDLITVTYLKEGFVRQPFRVLKMALGQNHRVTRLTAQIHQDAWYADSNGQATSAGGGRRQGDAGAGVPRPLLGDQLDGNGDVQFGVQEFATTAADGTAQTSVQVSFVVPPTVAVAGPQIPLVSLATSVGSGGSLTGGQTLYYAVAGVDGDGNEGGLSFLVRGITLSDGSSVTIGGLSFSPGTTGYRVYRGISPIQLFRIATVDELDELFTDTGLDKQLAAPADANFDHAKFYWRLELQPEAAVTIHGPTTIGNDALLMANNRYQGGIARITRGRGAGQERSITGNNPTTLTVSPAWTVAPDVSSHFVVTESGWQVGAVSQTSPVQFAIANRAGETVEILGRSANAAGVECAAEISVVTRWQIGGSGSADADVPPMPFFGLSAGQKGGSVELSGVSFTDLENTHTVSSGTLTVYCWDELTGLPTLVLLGGITDADVAVDLASAGTATAGSFVQVEDEVLRVDATENAGTRYRVTRAMHGSAVAAHAAGTPVFGLQRRTAIAPFPTDFFGSPYSGSWSFGVTMPDVRIASAELFVTNARGKSPARTICLTNTLDSGLRTLSGGQYSLQVEGYLAVEQSATPPLVVEATHAVRDVFAVLGSVADADVRVQVVVDGAAYCTLTVPVGQTTSAAAEGLGLGALILGSRVTLSILAVGQTYPGADLTVLIRL
jgi:Putative phage tail protein